MHLETHLLTKRRLMRLLSFLIDAAILAGILLLCERVFGAPRIVASIQALKALNGMGGTEEAFAAAYASFNETFNTAYLQSLLIWGGWEAAVTVLTGGRTVGKLIAGLRLVAVKQAEKRWLTALKLLLRAAIKPVLVLFFRGFPFMIAVILIFADRTDRTGYDRLSGLAPELVGSSAEKEG